MARHFPPGRLARGHRWVVGVVLVGLVGALAAPAVADRKDHLEDREDALGDKVDDARSDLDDSSRLLYRASHRLAAAQARLGDARAELATMRGRLDAARALDEQMRRRLAAAEQQLADAEDDLAAGEREVADTADRIESLAVQSINDAPTMSGLGVVLGGSDLEQLSARDEARDTFLDTQTAELDDLDAARIMLDLREQRVEQLRDDVAVQREQAAANLVEKRRLTAQARTQTEVVRALVDDKRLLRQRAAAAKEHDRRVLDRMERERDKVRDQLAALARQQERQAARGSGPTRTTTSGGQSDGFLSYPIEGSYITSPYGMRLHPILHYWKLHDGTDFGAACGTPVRAAAAGTVVSEYYNSGYGNRVIMNHGIVNGISLSTSYNHLTSFVASPGEYVQRGEVIAYSGTTGYSTGCHLHFMVYENGATVDPMGWL